MHEAFCHVILPFYLVIPDDGSAEPKHVRQNLVLNKFK